MVKHGPASWRWNDLNVGLSEGVNPFPGTIINVPHTHTGDQYELPFAAAGAIDYYVDDPNTTRNYVGSAWAITGTIGPVVVEGAWTRVLTGTYDGQVVPGLYLGGLNWTHPALGDLDGDGDLDLLVGERSGHLAWYRNQGNPASPNWVYKTADYAGVATGDWAYPALADVTGDGALDLFVGAGNGTVAVYYNAGTPAVPAWPDVPDEFLSVGQSAAPALGDLDGDGDLDLLVGHGGGTLTHFKNAGTAASPAWTLQSSNYGGISEAGERLLPAFVDLDGDGDLDVLIGLCGQLVWYRRGGTIGNPTWTRVGGDPIGYGGGSCANSPGVGDWDGDGDSDLAIGEHWGVLRFFRNNGVPSWAEQGFSFPFDLGGDSAPALADWDGDGDLDMLVGQVWGNVHRYINVGNATNPAWRYDDVLLTLPWTNHPHAFPALADVDGDGDYDLFVGEGGWQGEGAGGNIHYYRNDGTPSLPSWTLVTDAFLGLDVGGWSTPAFVDIDGDGDLDLFVGDEAGTLTFLENTGTATAPAWAAPAQPYAGLDLGSYSAPAFSDVDQDGDLDMLVGLESGSLAYVRNFGTATSPAWEFVTTAHPQIHVGHQATPVAADVDGDGMPDLVVGDGDGGLNLYLYDGPGLPPAAGGRFDPDDPLQIRGTLRLHSPAITSATDLDAIQVTGWLNMTMLFDQAGDAMPAENYFMSTMLTPSGLPIQRVERASQGLGGPISFQNLRYLGGHAVERDFTFAGRLPASTLPGVYRPWLWLEFTGVPTSTDWLAAYVTQFTFETHQAPLPPIVVGDAEPPHLTWQLLTDDFVQGTRGTGAREDRGSFELASQIVTQGGPYYTPPTDVRSGQPITYRLEPFLPAISFTDRRMPAPPLIPFDLPGGQLHVVVQEPDGATRDLGSEALAQSFNRTKTTRAGHDLNSGTVQLEDVYSLQAASERFRLTFDQYGHHVITMTGTVDDLWGNTYAGGGTYDVWIAHPLDVDPGVLPGTPLAVGDVFNPAVQVYPRVPADVYLTFTLYPDSDPSQAMTHTLSGRANRFGYFSPSDHASRLTRHGEYRVDLTATYTDPSGTLYMGAMTWGGVVMTPQSQGPHLVAHGRRGLDSLSSIPGNAWFVSCRDLSIQPGAISHTLNPYFNGDVLWSRMVDAPDECPAGVTSGGDSLVMGASVQDTVGAIEAAIQARHNRMWPELAAPGSFAERVAAGELPLFISTRSGRAPQLLLGKIGEVIPDDVDQIAYSYRSSQRPGVRVRELVAEDGQSGGYWRLDTLYDDQLGVGVLGDQPNDFKFQYLGLVYRDLQTGYNEYLGHGSGWIFIPDDDLGGSRAMPPFAGPGNGGWPTGGGPLLTLKGKDVHIFILPTGTRPGAVLEVGDTFRFAGHIMPTLDSRVAVTVTSPGGMPHFVAGQANSVGFFYDPDDDFVVQEPGLWSVDVRVWHDGECSGGTTVLPFPSGGVLGSEGGRYWFYVVPAGSPRLEVSAPSPGFLSFEGDVTPITIAGSLPAGLSDVVVDYTIAMPGFILEHGQATVGGETYQVVFDPATLSQTFPNLDLVGRDEWRPGLADTFAIGLLLQGQSGAGTVCRANTVTIQGEQVFVGQAQAWRPHGVYLPLILKGN
ncbi:MAG: VCBS repeat-containing protein [Anaerolineae bacterium]|nr:MAG: VCBS repeat-containing protein [Anaerolineae bacterium]